jgi:hypothetical protein
MVMCRTRFVVLAVLAVALAFPGAVAPAFASSDGSWGILNDSEEPGSVLVFHYFRTGIRTLSFTGQEELTVPRTELEISVTCPKELGENGCSKFPAKQDVYLRAHWVCPGYIGVANSGTTCYERDFPLSTTVYGTIYLHTQGESPDIVQDPESDFFVDYEDAPPPPCDEGYLIVWVVDDQGRAIKFDGLIGDAIVRQNYDSASGYNALPIQASSDLQTYDLTDLDAPAGDLDFDGREYKAITGKIFGTVRYEAPLNPDDIVEPEVEIAPPPKTKLTLLTLDVKSNRPNNPTFVDLNFYNEEERFISTSFAFVCWGQSRLRDIDDQLHAFFGRKGLVESTRAHKVAYGGVDDTTGDVTLIGIVTTVELAFYDQQEYSYSLYHDSEPVPTAFEPIGVSNNFNEGGGNNMPASSTLTFDDQTAGQGLDGEYQTGVADWGVGAWYLSGPWGGFTSNSISFSGSGVTSAPFAFITAQKLESVEAFNGGADPSTVTLSCGANPTKSVTVNPGELATIVTDWTNACSTVTIGSSNGWDTNFDNLTYRP